MIKESYPLLQQEIDEVSRRSPLSKSPPRLIAVSKKQPDERVDALLEAGHRIFGENRLQEAVNRWEKRKKRYDLELHFLGPLQTNKAAEVVTFFDIIHSLDRPKLAQKLAVEMEKQGRSLPCFIQVNTGEEPQKAGITPKEIEPFLYYCREELKLSVIGLMCLPPLGQNPAPHFALLYKIAERHGLPRLSMGMSNDWQTAIRMGTTDIRLGTAVFGKRPE